MLPSPIPASGDLPHRGFAGVLFLKTWMALENLLRFLLIALVLTRA
jgi:hypothetical protein